MGLVNYARPFIKNPRKLTGPLYSKLGLIGAKNFNKEEDLQIGKIKEAIRKLQDLKLPLGTNYLIIESDVGELGLWQY